MKIASDVFPTFSPNLIGLILVLSICTVLLSSCSSQIPSDIKDEISKLPDDLDFNIHVKPILSDRCYACHGPDASNQKAGLRLDNYEGATASLESDPSKTAIKGGSLVGSEMYHRLISHDPELVMPPTESDLTLSPREKAVLIKWIKDGAEYKDHWAFLPAKTHDLPSVANNDYVQNPIDNFVIKKLEEQDLSPSAEADKAMLLRRVSFDLTGLPPSVALINEFINDKSENAYEKVVDKLLNSVHYGEHMASTWMDVARFADTHGYTVDRYRDMSPWRDWVIDSYNKNMPYDQFVTWQLAGDLLPNPTKEQILATGFNRNHQQNMEGGIVEEEFRVEYVADRTNTFGTAFLGLTVECARCHDHKFDPITQKNYFELFSFFNNVNEAGQISWDDALPVPTMLLTSDETDEIINFIDGQLDEQEDKLSEITVNEEKQFEAWLANERSKVVNHNNPKGLVAHYNLDSKNIYNRLNPSQKGVMNQMFSTNKITPTITVGHDKNALLLDGDAWLQLDGVGVYDRADAFSVAMWVNIPKDLTDGVLFHKGIGAALYNFRGYHVALKDNKLQFLLAKTLPDNAIVKEIKDIPRDTWMHMVFSYDGSSQADGLTLFINGKEAKHKLIVDNLYKSLEFETQDGVQPSLQIGARWRGAGAKGAIVDEIKVFEKCISKIEAMQLADNQAYRVLAKKKVQNLASHEIAYFKEYYFNNISNNYQAEIGRQKTLRLKRNKITDTIPEVMVMKEMDEPRPTYILERGVYDAHGEQVYPSTPESLLPMDESFPRNRLGLAKWLTDKRNPLPSKVYVNRVWAQFFGTGLVTTANDFGNQGSLPTHPELLDYLATEFVSSGWDVKALLKLIATSGTYRQSSKASQELTEIDPNNVYYARGPGNRLSAEMMRDNVLSASGLLVEDVGGPSVKPYQPDGLWRINGTSYEQDEGDALYRRSMYTFWKRSVPNPSLTTFDAPDRSLCTVERQKTSTPLQALVLLNDPTYVEASKVIGYNITKAENSGGALVEAFQKLTGRSPSDGELQVLQELKKSEQDKFKKNPEKRFGWLNTGQFAVDTRIDKSAVAANTVVASAIINADATVIKR